MALFATLRTPGQILEGVAGHAFLWGPELAKLRETKPDVHERRLAGLMHALDKAVEYANPEGLDDEHGGRLPRRTFLAALDVKNVPKALDFLEAYALAVAFDLGMPANLELED